MKPVTNIMAAEVIKWCHSLSVHFFIKICYIVKIFISFVKFCNLNICCGKKIWLK